MKLTRAFIQLCAHHFAEPSIVRRLVGAFVSIVDAYRSRRSTMHDRALGTRDLLAWMRRLHRVHADTSSADDGAQLTYHALCDAVDVLVGHCASDELRASMAARLGALFNCTEAHVIDYLEHDKPTIPTPTTTKRDTAIAIGRVIVPASAMGDRPLDECRAYMRHISHTRMTASLLQALAACTTNGEMVVSLRHLGYCTSYAYGMSGVVARRRDGHGQDEHDSGARRHSSFVSPPGCMITRLEIQACTCTL